MQGFTLIETMVSVAILAIVFAIGFQAMSGVTQSVRTSQSSAQLLQAFTTASAEAQLGRNGSPWGVHLEFDEGTRVLENATVFAGTSYALRNTVYDTITTFPSSVTVVSSALVGSGVSTGNEHEVVFAPLSSDAALYGSVVVRTQERQETFTISPYGDVTHE